MFNKLNILFFIIKIFWVNNFRYFIKACLPKITTIVTHMQYGVFFHQIFLNFQKILKFVQEFVFYNYIESFQFLILFYQLLESHTFYDLKDKLIMPLLGFMQTFYLTTD